MYFRCSVANIDWQGIQGQIGMEPVFKGKKQICYQMNAILCIRREAAEDLKEVLHRELVEQGGSLQMALWKR